MCGFVCLFLIHSANLLCLQLLLSSLKNSWISGSGFDLLFYFIFLHSLGFNTIKILCNSSEGMVSPL